MSAFVEAQKAYKKIKTYGVHNLLGGYLTPLDQQVLNWLRFELASKPFINMATGYDYEKLLNRFSNLTRSAMRTTVRRLIDMKYLEGNYLGRVSLPKLKGSF